MNYAFFKQYLPETYCKIEFILVITPQLYGITILVLAPLTQERRWPFQALLLTTSATLTSTSDKEALVSSGKHDK